MYQQQMMIQFTDEQLCQQCPIKAKESRPVINYMKRDIPHTVHNMPNVAQHHYQHYNRPKKPNQWNNNYKNLRYLTGYGQNLSQSQETLSVRPPSHDSQSDTSSEEFNEGVKLVPDRYLARSQQMEVKDTPRQLVSGSKWDQLSTDIWHKFMKNQQTSENYIHKMNLFKHLYSNIKSYLRYSVFVVGSTFNGFGTNTSDLDLCLVIRNQNIFDLRQDAIYNLLQTRELLLNLGKLTGTEFQRLELIEAKVPLLKFHCLGLDVDINCNNPVGIRNTHLLHCYAKADWRVQPLAVVVKLWASVHQINDAKNMTISSYSLALMVIHFLQCGTLPAVLPCLQLDFPEKFRNDREIHEISVQETLKLPPTTNTQSLGELLLQFFYYYNNFNYEENAISVRMGSTLPVEHCRLFPSLKNEPRAWSYLCIEEPFDHTNTARAVYDQEKFEMIRKVFKVSYHRLQETNSLESIFLPV